MNLQVQNDANAHDGRNGNLVAPVCQDQVEGRDFKGDEDRLVEEEVPANPETERFVDPVASHADETTRNRHVGSHLGHGVVDQAEHTAVQGVGQEQASRTALDQTVGDGYEGSSTNGTTDGNQLDLTIAQVSSKLIDVVDMANNLVGLIAIDIVRGDISCLLVVLGVVQHDWYCTKAKQNMMVKGEGEGGLDEREFDGLVDPEPMDRGYRRTFKQFGFPVIALVRLWILGVGSSLGSGSLSPQSREDRAYLL